ncbi:MAG TPA: hypothetical protein VFZ01_16225 [Geminicoccaceae bacterium]
MAPIKESAEEARQGERKGWISRVLIVSTALAVAFMIGTYIFSV